MSGPSSALSFLTAAADPERGPPRLRDGPRAGPGRSPPRRRSRASPRARPAPATPRPSGREQPARRGRRVVHWVRVYVDWATVAPDAEMGARRGATALIALPTVLAFFSGGFFDKPRLTAALVAWTARRPSSLSPPLSRCRRSRSRAASRCSGCSLLCAWTALSFAWAPLGGARPGRPAAPAAVPRLHDRRGRRCCAGAAVRRCSSRRWCCGAFVVVGYGLSERFLPG